MEFICENCKNTVYIKPFNPPKLFNTKLLEKIVSATCEHCKTSYTVELHPDKDKIINLNKIIKK